MKKINFIGYASGIAAENPGCADGPIYLQQHVDLSQVLPEASIQWQILPPRLELPTKKDIVAELSQRLAQATASSVAQHEPFVAIAGDHSSGIGTWSGAAHAIESKGDLGLIWMDAHLDAHTFETTPSGNIHGMPVATLLGFGDPALTHIASTKAKIKPEHLSIIGARSFEDGELALLNQLNVRIYFIEEVKERGFEVVFAESLARATQGTQGYGISIDLDALDPIFAPGTGTPEPNGLCLQEVCAALNLIKQDPRFVGLEIAEFNPHECNDERTIHTICQMLAASFA